MPRSRCERQKMSRSRAPLAVAASVLVFAVVAPIRAEEPQSTAGRTFAQPGLRMSTFPPDAPKASSSAGPAIDNSAVVAASGTAPAAPVPSTIKVEPAWPKTLPEAKSEAQPPHVEAYSPQEIAGAKAHCSAVLKGLDVVVIDEQPFKSGSCGTPAPVQLISIGKNPQVALSPPVTVTCDMVAAMHKWVTQELQPLSKKSLGAPLVGIETMSSYSCRNAYGRKRTNLSEHGRANALDIRSFMTADAKETTVLADWGPTGWEIRAQVAAASKAAAEKAAAEKLAAEKAAKAQQMIAGQPAAKGNSVVAAPAPANPPTNGTSFGALVDSVPVGIASKLPGAATAGESRTGFGLTKPAHLGGPKVPPETPAATDALPQGRKAQFLRAAHDSACKIFGTTLGPETNLAHKNHFHVDMAERSRGNFCE